MMVISATFLLVLFEAIVNVNVIASNSAEPSKPVIYDNEGKIVSNVTNAFDEHSNVNLICEVKGGNNMLNVTWLWEEKLVDDSFELQADGLIINYLNFPNVGRQHFNTKMTCKVLGGNLTSPLTTDVVLNINLRPHSAKILNKQIQVSAGKVYEVKCVTSGSHPEAVITWRKSNKRLASNLWKNDQNLSVLTFKPKMDDDDEDLTCRAENLLIPDSALEDTWKLNVYYAPLVALKLVSLINIDDIKEGDDISFECAIRSNPHVTQQFWFINSTELHPNVSAGILKHGRFLKLRNISRTLSGVLTCSAENSEATGRSNSIHLKIKHKPMVTIVSDVDPGDIKEGDNVSFECYALAYPRADGFIWFYNGAEMYENMNSGIAIRNQRLTFFNISRPTVGELTCMTSNEIGDGTSKPVTLNVKYAPICVEGKEVLVVPSPNEELKLQCKVKSNPAAVSFRWAFDNSKYLTDIAAERFTNTFDAISTSQLNYSVTPPFDYGNVLCWAENEVGRQRDACVYKIVRKGPPFPLQNCELTDKTIDSIRIACKENFDGGSPQKFLMEILEIPSLKLKFQKTLNRAPPIFSIKGLSIVKTYRIFLYAVNIQGRSNAFIIDNVSTNGVNTASGSEPAKIKVSSTDALLEAFSKTQQIDSLYKGEFLNELKGLNKALDEIRKELRILNDMNKIRARIEYQDALTKYDHFDLHIEF